MLFGSWQNQRNSFRQIANNMIAFLKKPKRNAANFRSPKSKKCCIYGTFWTAMRKNCNRPKFIGIIRVLKICSERRNLFIGFVGAVKLFYELGEIFHGLIFVFYFLFDFGIFLFVLGFFGSRVVA